MRGRYLERAFWAYHRFLDRASGGRFKETAWGRPQSLWLTTVGRRTGTIREIALIYALDGERLLVAASNAGQAIDPSWWLNLRERPDTEARIGTDRRLVRARQADPAERDRLWPLLDAVYPTFARYRASTTRTIPVIILEPR